MLNALTSFRFIAALMVFLFHVQIFSQYNLGSAGVQFFFVLSGFILAYNYHSQFYELNKTNISKFYRARLAKIYPVHLLTFLISTPLVILYFNPNGLYLIKLGYMSTINLMLVQSFFPNQATYFNFNGVSWTLSIELFFYLMFPFILWAFSKMKVTKNKVKISAFFVILWCILFILNRNLDEINQFRIWILHVFPVTRMFEFSLGMLLGLIFVQTQNKQQIHNDKMLLFTAMEILSLTLFLGLLLYSRRLDVGIVRGVYFAPVWCMLIYTFAFQRGCISKALSNKILVFLGEISFSFYMIHQLVIRYFSYLHMESVMNSIICFTVSVSLGALCYLMYEEPLRKKLRYGFRRNYQNPLITAPSNGLK